VSATIRLALVPISKLLPGRLTSRCDALATMASAKRAPQPSRQTTREPPACESKTLALFGSFQVEANLPGRRPVGLAQQVAPQFGARPVPAARAVTFLGAQPAGPRGGRPRRPAKEARAIESADGPLREPVRGQGSRESASVFRVRPYGGQPEVAE
jgi:hypothetical protein